MCTPGSDPGFSAIFECFFRFHDVNFVKNLCKIVKFYKILQNFAKICKKCVFPGPKKGQKAMFLSVNTRNFRNFAKNRLFCRFSSVNTRKNTCFSTKFRSKFGSKFLKMCQIPSENFAGPGCATRVL